MAATWVDIVVFGPAAGPIAYTQLSLGAVYADKLVYLKFKSDDAFRWAAVKPGVGSGADPHPENWHDWIEGVCGTNEFQPQNASDCAILAVTADDLGDVRWITDAGTVWTVTLMVAQDVTLVWGGAYHTGAAPGAWTAKDVSALMGVVDRLAWSKCMSAAVGPKSYRHRYTGDPLNVHAGPYESSHTAANVAQGVISLALSGVVDHQGDDTIDVYLGCYSDDWTNTIAHGSNPIHNGPTPIAESNLDLSPIVGAQRVVALVKIVGTTSPRNNIYIKPEGDANTYAYGNGNTVTGAAYPFGCCGAWPYGFAPGYGTYQIVFTNAAGVARWGAVDAANSVVTVLGYDVIAANIGPTLTGTAPVGFVASISHIEFTTEDIDDGVDQTTISLVLTDPAPNILNAIIGGVIQPGYSGSIVANLSGGFDISITVDGGMTDGVWSAYAYCEDFTGASDDDTWGWTANAPPVVTGTAPIGTCVSTAAIEFTTTDSDDGVDPATIHLILTDPMLVASNAIIAGVIQPGYSGSIVANLFGGFDISITVDAGMSSGVWQAVAACQDFVPEGDSDTWGWTVDDPPTLIGTLPILGSTTYEHAIVAFTTTDDVGVDPLTISLDLTAPDTTVYHALVAGVFDTGSGWNGTIVANAGNGYDVTLTSHPLFTDGTWQADAACDDTIGQSATESWPFTVVVTPVGALYIGS